MKKFAFSTLALCAAMSVAPAHATSQQTMLSRTLSAIHTHADQTRWSSRDSFKLVRVITDADGSTHLRFDRSYAGLRVIGGDIVVHNAPDGAFRSASLTMTQPIAVDISAATIQPAQARAFAKGLFEGKISGKVTVDLVIYAGDEAAPELAYDVVVSGMRADATPSSMHMVVSARGLNLLNQWDDIKGDAAEGSGNTLFSGAVTLTTDKVDGGFEMRDPTRGDHYVGDLNGATSGTGTLFTSEDNVWGDSTTSDRATVAADALYGQNMTWDYYKEMFGRDGIADDGNGGYSRVHYSTNYVNAFWSDSCFCMTYGDGDGSSYEPLVTLDIIGHEMTHGVTANSAALIYSGEPGGLNESMSDIMGTMVEYYADNANQVPNYLIGERIYVSNEGNDYPTKALRYMFKPSLDGVSPDCYRRSVKLRDPHYSSAIGNHFFYLLAEGTTVPTGFEGTLTESDLTCNGASFNGAGRDKAAQIVYRALTVYMTSLTNYAEAREATLQSAADLYGDDSSAYNKVNKAWKAVSVQ